MEEWYGEKLQENPDIPRIVNEKHFNRLKGLLESTNGTLVFGGKSDANDLWIEPSIVGKEIRNGIRVENNFYFHFRTSRCY